MFYHHVLQRVWKTHATFLHSYLGHALSSVTAGNQIDETIIPSIGSQNGILITKDLNIHKTRLQYQLCEQYKIGVFFLKMQKGLDRHWEIVKLLINSWEEILVKLVKEKRPFGYEIPLRGRMKKL